MDETWDIDLGDTVRTLESRNGTPTKTWTAVEFTEWLTGYQAKFPQLTYRVGTEYDCKRTTGKDFFLVMCVRPGARERAFIVKKGEQ